MVINSIGIDDLKIEKNPYKISKKLKNLVYTF